MSPNSNNPVLVSRIDDHSPRRKKKLPVQSAVLLSSAPRRLTGQNVGGISLGYEGVHVCRGWGFHGAHAGSRQRSPQRAPSLWITRATNLSGTIFGGLSAHRLARRQFHAHSGWLIQISGNGDSGTQSNSQWNGKTTSAAAQSVRGCSAWLG